MEKLPSFHKMVYYILGSPSGSEQPDNRIVTENNCHLLTSGILNFVEESFKIKFRRDSHFIFRSTKFF